MSQYPLPYQWGVACGAILTQMNQGTHGVLGGALPTPQSEATAGKILASGWGAEDRDGLLEVLTWLLESGHRSEWVELAGELDDFDEREVDQDDADEVEDARKKRFIRQNAAWLGGRPLVAWDAGRLVSVAGWGFLARLVGPEEAWAHVMTAARAIQYTYRSWPEFAQHYAFGRHFWNDASDARFDGAVGVLTGNPSSPWAQLPWQTSLDTPGVATLAWSWQPAR